MNGRKKGREETLWTGQPDWLPSDTVKLSHLKGFFLVLLGDLERRSLFSLNCRTHHSKPVLVELELVSLYLTVTLIPSLLQLSFCLEPTQRKDWRDQGRGAGGLGWADWNLHQAIEKSKSSQRTHL